jgi:hypothetical protein
VKRQPQALQVFFSIFRSVQRTYGNAGNEDCKAFQPSERMYMAELSIFMFDVRVADGRLVVTSRMIDGILEGCICYVT